jgi:orotate phosphoribosyltransferase
VVDVLRDQGAEVLGMCALFTYGFPVADEAFEKAGLPLYTISNYKALMEVCEEQNIIAPEQKETLEQWRVDPGNWNK